MSRGLRLMGAAVLACASVPVFGVGAAHADTASLIATNGAYFNASGLDKPEAAPAAPPNPAATADGVSPENLPVASKAGTEDKVSFLYFDMFALPAGITVEKAVVSLTLVPNGPNDITVNAAPERVQACKAGDKGFSGDDGANLDGSAPARLCKDFSVKGVASKDLKAYEFDVTALAATWAEGVNDGVAFTRSDEAASSSFQVVFGKASTATLALTYALPVDTSTPPYTPPVDLGGSVTPPDLGTGFAPTPDTGFAPGVPSVDTPIVPNPTVNEPPVAAPAQPATRNVAAISTSMRPTTGFWLAGLGMAIALALLSLVFGDSRVPSVQHSRSRLTLALSSRQGLATAKAGFRTLPA